MKITERFGRGPAASASAIASVAGAARGVVVGGVVDAVAVDRATADGAVEVRLDGDVFVAQHRVAALDDRDDVVGPMVGRRRGGKIDGDRLRQLERRRDSPAPRRALRARRRRRARPPSTPRSTCGATITDVIGTAA